MSAWKRDRGWTERHGWGESALARWIGRQRREARRPTGRALPVIRCGDELLSEMIAAEELFREATAVYESVDPADAETFDLARAVYVAADERRDALREAWRASSNPT